MRRCRKWCVWCPEDKECLECQEKTRVRRERAKARQERRKKTTSVPRSKSKCRLCGGLNCGPGMCSLRLVSGKRKPKKINVSLSPTTSAHGTPDSPGWRQAHQNARRSRSHNAFAQGAQHKKVEQQAWVSPDYLQELRQQVLDEQQNSEGRLNKTNAAYRSSVHGTSAELAYAFNPDLQQTASRRPRPAARTKKSGISPAQREWEAQKKAQKTAPPFKPFPFLHRGDGAYKCAYAREYAPFSDRGLGVQ